MKRNERNELAANVFSQAWDRESNLPCIDRMREACGAVLDVFFARYVPAASPAVLAQIDAQRPPIVVDEIRDASIVKTAMPVLRQMAAKHGCDVSDLLGDSRDFVVARDEACWSLSRGARMKQADIGNLFAVTQAAVSLASTRHKKRVVAAGAKRKEANGG